MALSQFTRPENGLAAVLEAQEKKLSLIIEQLNDVQEKLSDMDQKLISLPSEIRTMLSDQHRDELVLKLRSSAQQYSHYLDESRKDKNVFRRARDSLILVAQEAQSAGTQLSLLPGGGGPAAAFVLPLFLMLQISLDRALRTPSSHATRKVETVAKWGARLLSSEKGGINQYIVDAANDHDQLIDKVVARAKPSHAGAPPDSGTWIMGQGILDFKLRGAQRTQAPGLCIFGSLQTGSCAPVGGALGPLFPAGVLWGYGSLEQRTWGPKLDCQRTYVATGLSSRPHDEVGVKMIDYKREGAFVDTPPQQGGCYFVQFSDSQTSLSLNDFETHEKIMEIEKALMPELEVLITALNVQRLKIKYGTDAAIVVAQTLERMKVLRV